MAKETIRRIAYSVRYCEVVANITDEGWKENARKLRQEYTHYPLYKDLEQFFTDQGCEVTYHARQLKMFPNLKESHRYSKYKDMECHIELSTNHIKWQFYQNVNKGKNRNGGEFDFDKLDFMTYTQRLRLQVLIRHLVEYISARYPNAVIENLEANVNETSTERILREYRESWHNTSVASLDDIEEHDENRSRYATYNNKDANGKTIHTGEMKYWYCGKYLRRGRVYHNCNNMWWVLVNERELHNVVCYHLFDYEGQPIKLNQDDKQIKRLNRLYEDACKDKNLKLAQKYLSKIEKLEKNNSR